MTEKTALFSIIGRYGKHHWACATVSADLVWNKLSKDSPDLPKNACVYQISNVALNRPDGSCWRVNMRSNVITECIEEIKSRGVLTAKGAVRILEELKDGR